MKRRDFLKLSSFITASAMFGTTAFSISDALGNDVSLLSLHNNLNPKDGEIVLPSDANFEHYQLAYNKRTVQVPIARVLCYTPEGVAAAIMWAKENKVPLAIRSGGHSFEGLSQTTGLAIDTRFMNQTEIAYDSNSFVTGPGTQLGSIYQSLSEYKRALPAGSCPSVGVAGHTLGGGYGLLARPFGLACDSLLSAEVVDANGKIINCSSKENSDLFWALRGGGSGSFGIVTKMQFKTHKVEKVLVYSMSWKVSLKDAIKLIQIWLKWAPNAPREITSLMRVSRSENVFTIRYLGQTIGTEKDLQKEFSRLPKNSNITIKPLEFMESVAHFSGGEFGPTYAYMKGKSDYVKEVMSDQALNVFLKGIPSSVAAIFDSYGGAISDLKDNETSFAHRSGILSSIQYYTQWGNPATGRPRMALLEDYYQSLRPYMPGLAYFNYCDLELKNWARAYWGKNLERLVEVKRKYDSEDIFKHAQSIPLVI